MSKHTPGPWEDLGLDSPFGYVIKLNGGKSISYIAAYDFNADDPEPYGPWGAESEANRTLVLAGPDLYDAAENALGVLIACCVPAGGVDDSKAILDAQAMLRAALAKATGEAS